MARKKPTARNQGDSLLGSIIRAGTEAVVERVWNKFCDWLNSPPAPEPIVEEKHRPQKSQPSPKKRGTRKPPSWWKVLGVPQDATREQITRAYRDLMTGCHPDKVAHLSPQLRKVAEREAKKLNAAREAALQDCGRRN